MDWPVQEIQKLSKLIVEIGDSFMVRRTLARLESDELTLQGAISGLRGIFCSSRPTSERLRMARVGDHLNRTQLNALTNQTEARPRVAHLPELALRTQPMASGTVEPAKSPSSPRVYRRGRPASGRWHEISIRRSSAASPYRRCGYGSGACRWHCRDPSHARHRLQPR